MKSDIQIAKEAKLKKINTIAESLGISTDDVYKRQAQAHRHRIAGHDSQR